MYTLYIYWITAYSYNFMECYIYSYSVLSAIEIDLKKASKTFAQHFSCGSSVTGDDEVVVQGDVTDDIFDLIQKHWPEVCR